MANRQGRPRTWGAAEQQGSTEAASLSQTVQRMRAEFEAMPPKKQIETVELVERCLADERRDIQLQRRRAPSPLAYLAVEVYGIAVEWVPDHARKAVEVSQ